MRMMAAVVLLVIGCGSGGGTNYPPPTVGTGVGGATSGGMGGGGGQAPQSADYAWSISFRAASWYCNGPMNTHAVTGVGVVTMTGAWNCSGLCVGCDPPGVAMAGTMTGTYTPGPETIRLSLATSTRTIPVDGTLGPLGIVGTAHFAGSDVGFTAQ